MAESKIELRDLPLGVELQPGFHSGPEEGMCALEAVSWMAGLPHSDQPRCVCGVLQSLLRSMNDRMTHCHRQSLVPFLPRLVGTRDPALAGPRAKALVWRAITDFAPIPLAAARFPESSAVMAKLSRRDPAAARSIVSEIETVVGASAWAEAEASGAKVWDLSARVLPATWNSVEVVRLVKTALDQLLDSEADWDALATTACQILVIACRFDNDAWPLALDALEELLAIARREDTVVRLEDYRKLANQAA